MAIVGFISVMIIDLTRKNNITKILERQALKRNGTIKKSNYLTTGDSPHITFKRNDFTIELFCHLGGGGEGSTQHTGIEIHFNSKLPSTIETNIDSKFIIKGDNEPYASIFLSENFQNKLLKYRHLRPDIKFEKDKIIIKIYRILNKDEDYDNLIEFALLYCDFLKSYISK